MTDLPEFAHLYYSDVVAAGGLEQAIMALIARQGMEVPDELGEDYLTAKFGRGNRAVGVSLCPDQRMFSVDVSWRGRVVSWGATARLEEVVSVIDAWRSRRPAADLMAASPMLQADAESLSYDGGDPVAARWQSILNSDEFTAERKLLSAIYADEKLRALYPFVRHMTQFGLELDHFDRSAGGILIDATNTDRYVITASWKDRPQYASSQEDVVAIAAALVR